MQVLRNLDKVCVDLRLAGRQDRAVQTARRKAIYLELHPETAAGAAQAAGMNRSVGNNVADNLSVTFTAETAKATGKDERSVRRDAERAVFMATNFQFDLL